MKSRYIRHTGRFVGTTALGAYRMAFEIVAPADSGLGNRTVLIEPPHFVFGPAGRDLVLSRAFVFGHGFSYATVGFGTVGLNILDSAATDLVLAGEPVGDLGPGPVTDFDILVQFVHALSSEPFAVAALGVIEGKAGYGVSETAEVWEVVFHRPGGQSLLDFTLLDRDVWRAPALDVLDPAFLENLPQEFTPLTGVGKVIYRLVRGRPANIPRRPAPQVGARPRRRSRQLSPVRDRRRPPLCRATAPQPPEP